MGAHGPGVATPGLSRCRPGATLPQGRKDSMVDLRLPAPWHGKREDDKLSLHLFPGKGWLVLCTVTSGPPTSPTRVTACPEGSSGASSSCAAREGQQHGAGWALPAPRTPTKGAPEPPQSSPAQGLAQHDKPGKPKDVAAGDLEMPLDQYVGVGKAETAGSSAPPPPLQSGPRHVGLLGSRRRCASTEGPSPEVFKNSHSPLSCPVWAKSLNGKPTLCRGGTAGCGAVPCAGPVAPSSPPDPQMRQSSAAGLRPHGPLRHRLLRGPEKRHVQVAGSGRCAEVLP